MEEKHTAGNKEFFISIVWAIALFVVSQYICAAMPEYKIVGNIFSIILFCILGFFVLTRYCATFTYTIKNGRIRINRMIGRRNKEVDFAISNIKSISCGAVKLNAKNIYNMTTKAFSKKGTCSIVYNRTGIDEAVIIEPSNEMLKQIKTLMKKKDWEDK
ncbi:MAG: hypothetical protein ACI4C7_06850 [Clostridia bacterium]